LIRIFFPLFLAACLVLAFAAGTRYAGQWHIYFAFTIVANALLFNGFRKNALYFDLFIGLFLWLGFWLKFSIRLAFAGGQFHEPVGAFDGSMAHFDQALTVASWGLAGLLVASLVRQRFFTYPASFRSCSPTGLFQIYAKYRSAFIGVYLLLVAAVAISNIWLGIYQRGMIAQTILPFGLNGIYKWLLQFGLATIAAMIIRFELELNRKLTYTAVILPLLEGFLSNVALLSRGMILNASALGIGVLRTVQSRNIRVTPKMVITMTVAFAALFSASVFAVNFLRSSSLMMQLDLRNSPEVATPNSTLLVESAKEMTTPLFIDRWVGIEGVMAVSSSDRLGWKLWQEAWEERFQEGKLSLYDRYFIDSPYNNASIDKSRHHFISLPGLVAFFYYPGSLWFLFAGLFTLGGIAALFEVFTFKFTGENLVICSLLAQVVAFRYASLGYVPSQSYLLFGTLVLNVLLIAAVDWFVKRHVARNISHG
jgi:hypothetical protein